LVKPALADREPLVALIPPKDLFFHAKDLFIATMVDGSAHRALGGSF
jgi:hypothetical protein